MDVNAKSRSTGMRQQKERIQSQTGTPKDSSAAAKEVLTHFLAFNSMQ
jgi:hypothetical protein